MVVQYDFHKNSNELKVESRQRVEGTGPEPVNCRAIKSLSLYDKTRVQLPPKEQR